MHVEDTDALKAWLIVVLAPLCDADSSALARYVLALLKKDKPEEELKAIMTEQLDVFLNNETIPFVDKLFEAVKTKSYLEGPPAGSEGLVLQLGDGEGDGDADADEEGEEGEGKANETVAENADNETKEIAKIAIPTTDVEEAEGEPEAAPEVVVEEDLLEEENELTLDDDVVDEDVLDDSYELFEEDHIAEMELFEEEAKEDTKPVTVPTSSATSHASGNDTLNAKPSNQVEKAPVSVKDRLTFNRSRESKLQKPTNDRKNDDNRLPRKYGNAGNNKADMDRNRFYHDDRQAKHNRDNVKRRLEREELSRNSGLSLSPYLYDRRRRNLDNGRSNSADRSNRNSGFMSGNGNKTRRNRSNSPRSRSPSPDIPRSKRTGAGEFLLNPADHNQSPARVNNKPGSEELKKQEDLQQQQQSQQQSPIKRQRCRDFDEKGYCVRGETCPWDHGVNPVVFDNNGTLLGMGLREYNPDAPDLWARTAASIIGGPNNIPPPNVNVMNPFANPGMRPGGGIMMGEPPAGFGMDKNINDGAGLQNYGPNYRTAGPMMPFPFGGNPVATPMQRQLIPIPVVDPNTKNGGDLNHNIQPGKRRYELEDSVAVADCPTKRKVPINSRLGPRPANIQSNCSLELRKVPRGLNTIAHLNNHFSKFGKITNIQVTYEGDPEAAIVSFSTHAEANVAYRSTEAVLNNRFIKVFWHNPDNSSESMQPHVPRKGSQYHLSNIPAVPIAAADSAKTTTVISSSQTTVTTTTATGSSVSDTSTTSTVTTPSTGRTKMPRMPIVSVRKKQEEQKQAMAQLSKALLKRKQDLITSYLKQMKTTVAHLERMETTDPNRAETMATIKALQDKIDKIRKEISTEHEQVQTPPIKKTKEQQKKELLDIELELFAQQQEGNDTSHIQKRLEELQRSLGISSANGVTATAATVGKPPTHFSGARASPRQRPPFSEGSTRVDRRSKAVIVTGFSSEEADFVLGHFKHFGEISKHDLDKDMPRLILSYATRTGAEQAVLRGKIFKDKRLQVVWAPVVNVPAPQGIITPLQDKTGELENKINLNATKPPSTGNDLEKSGSGDEKSNQETTEETNTLTLPELSIEDEEDEEEGESRSWRR